jgi:hypothetical protein
VDIGDRAAAARDVGELEEVGNQQLVVPRRLALVLGQVVGDAQADRQRRLRIGRRQEGAVGRHDALDALGDLLDELLGGEAVVREPRDRIEAAL